MGIIDSALRRLGVRAAARPPQRERGYAVSDLTSWGALQDAQDEANPDLRWPYSLDVWDRMRREESQVTSVLKAVTLPVLRTNWALDGAGCRPAVTSLVAEDLGLPVRGVKTEAVAARRRNKVSWDEHLRLAQLELVYGHSVFEQVYRIVAGQARLHKLAFRPPRTIDEWKVARDGGLEWIRQKDTPQPLRVNRLVVYVNGREGGNWIGESLLRPAYKNWLLKDRILRAQALTIDRNGLGVPVYEGAPVPDGADAAYRDAWIEQENTNGLEVATGFRSGETAGASIPNGAKLTLQGVQGDLPETDKPVRYHDEQMARAVLAHFLNLGTETGSWALGSTFADFFSSSLQTVALHLADVAQQHIIDDLVALNWGDDEPSPRLVFDEIGSKSDPTAEAIKLLVDAGVIVPDDDLETYVRQRYSLPVADSATRRTSPEEGA